MPITKTSLSIEECRRYGRQLILPEVGEQGQMQLKQARVLIVGLGGLGCPAAMYLASAGIGRLGLADGDRVDASNLQRQVLYTTSEVGKAKVAVGRRRLAAMNPEVTVVGYNESLSSQNAQRIIQDYDLVLDCTDNFSARFLINDVCLQLGKIFIHGSVHRFEGQVAVFGASKGPCYRCLHPAAPPESIRDCAEAGILGAAAGIIGTLQAAEAIKWLLGFGEASVGRLYQMDLRSMMIRSLRLHKEIACLGCGENSKASTSDSTTTTNSSCHSDHHAIDAHVLRKLFERTPPPLLIDIRHNHERASGAIDGALWIPASDLATRLNGINRSRQIVVFCQIGSRSRWAAKMLREMGFESAVHLAGGFYAWSDPLLITAALT